MFGVSQTIPFSCLSYQYGNGQQLTSSLINLRPIVRLPWCPVGHVSIFEQARSLQVLHYPLDHLIQALLF